MKNPAQNVILSLHSIDIVYNMEILDRVCYTFFKDNGKNWLYTHIVFVLRYIVCGNQKINIMFVTLFLIFEFTLIYYLFK